MKRSLSAIAPTWMFAVLAFQQLLRMLKSKPVISMQCTSGSVLRMCSTILVSALGIAAITGLYLYHCSRNGTLYNSVMPYSHRPNFDFDLSGMKLVAFVFSLTSAAVFVVLIVALVVMSHTSLLTTHTELLMKLAYMDVAAVHATSLSFIAAVLFGIGDAYKSMH